MSISANNELVIRPAQLEDFEGLAALLTEPLMQSNAQRCLNRLALAQIAKAENASELHLLALLKEKVVGRTRLRLKGEAMQTGELGIAVHANYQGRKIGSALLEAVIQAADHRLGVKRIELKVFRDNLRAIHLYEKYGFIHMGVDPALAFNEQADRLIMMRP
jgi:putative acetyltransferase